jgi:hypothetical protein
MARADVKITNGDMEAWVTARAAQTYERHGWTVVDDGSSEPEAEPAPVSPEPDETTTSREAE